MTNDTKKAMATLEKRFGSREGMLGYMLIELSIFGQPFDVTFFNRKPILEVRLGPKIGSAIMYGAGKVKLAELLNRIEFSDGTVAGLGEIWTINPMPKEGFPEGELQAVDISDAEASVVPNGETLREMIRKTYHCTSVDEEERYIRRFLAS